ncbi:hypothetical protein HYPSUDRAFT_264231 [Hypholoma sublateritium FD-334 SS-4]|uniref:Uncharacterized protein n=1 Tax=Hypholoma sublateritium (strain FD-334 SS-4) TaxID=945553 RepID=A0A0D2N1A6_HYPSF|nr:hypothetical protein HYPSUDRAFT_264231 [Hypholoma sublateritium FD-334 SS-4]
MQRRRRLHQTRRRSGLRGSQPRRKRPAHVWLGCIHRAISRATIAAGRRASDQLFVDMKWASHVCMTPAISRHVAASPHDTSRLVQPHEADRCRFTTVLISTFSCPSIIAVGGIWKTCLQ